MNALMGLVVLWTESSIVEFERSSYLLTVTLLMCCFMDLVSLVQYHTKITNRIHRFNDATASRFIRPKPKSLWS